MIYKNIKTIFPKHFVIIIIFEKTRHRSTKIQIMKIFITFMIDLNQTIKPKEQVFPL